MLHHVGIEVVPANIERTVELWQLLGFELVEPPPSLFRPLHALGDSVSAWSLTRAFNPAALSRQRFRRDHHELWISQAMLLKWYARATRKTGDAQPHRAA